MEHLNRHCQSCGMPLKHDKQGGGTNADGSHSTMYCSYCYQDGKFLQPEMTVAQMQALSRQKLVERGVPGFVAGMLTRGIPKLARWQQAPASKAA